MSVPAKPWPVKFDSYELIEEIGQGGSATVWRARCRHQDVAVKVIDMEVMHYHSLCSEIAVLSLARHPNVVQFHAAFVHDDKLHVVTPLFSGGSVLDVIRSKYTNGLAEGHIATILREVLKGLNYLHTRCNAVHRDVKAGNIMIDATSVCIGDVGVATMLVEEGRRKQRAFSVVGTMDHVAPEVKQLSGYTYSADLYSFGITALELAGGHVPEQKSSPLQPQPTPPTLSDQGHFSKAFREMIDSCVVLDAAKRPSCAKLLESKFFKSARGVETLDTLLVGLPSLGSRYEVLRRRRFDAPRPADEPPPPEWDFGADDALREQAQTKVKKTKKKGDSSGSAKAVSASDKQPRAAAAGGKECDNCAGMRAQIAALEARVRELEKQLSRTPSPAPAPSPGVPTRAMSPPPSSSSSASSAPQRPTSPPAQVRRERK